MANPESGNPGQIDLTQVVADIDRRRATLLRWRDEHNADDQRWGGARRQSEIDFWAVRTSVVAVALGAGFLVFAAIRVLVSG